MRRAHFFTLNIVVVEIFDDHLAKPEIRFFFRSVSYRALEERDFYLLNGRIRNNRYVRSVVRRYGKELARGFYGLRLDSYQFGYPGELCVALYDSYTKIVTAGIISKDRVLETTKEPLIEAHVPFEFLSGLY